MVGFYFILGTLVFALIGYLTGRFVVPKILFPLSAWTMGRFAFALITVFLIVRTGMQLMARPWLVDWHAITESYADGAVIASMLAIGYDGAKRAPKSIKGGLAIAPDGGLHIVDVFTEQTSVSLGSKDRGEI